MPNSEILTVEHENGVAVMVFDLAGEPVNKLSAAAREAFEQAFAALQADASVQGIVFISGKPDNFIAGADIDELSAVKFNTDAERLSTLGHEMLER